MGVSWRISETVTNLDSRPGLQHLWFNWRAIGIHPTRRYQPLYFLYAAFVNVVFAIGIPATMVSGLLFVDSAQEAIDNLCITGTALMATIKQYTILSCRRNLLSVNCYLQQLDARCNPNREDRLHIIQAMRTSRRVYLTLMVLYGLPSLGFAYLGFSRRQLSYQAWFPNFVADPELQLTIVLIYQNIGVLGYIVTNQVGNDVYPACYLRVLIGHIRALAGRIRRIGTDPTHSLDDNMDELLRCIQDYKNVLSYFDCIAPAISRTLFLQFATNGFVLCLTVVNFQSFSKDIEHMLIGSFYSVAVLVEALPSCWYANTFMHECTLLTLALYSCRWYDQDQKFRRTLIIFMQRTQRTGELMAGGLLPVSLQTFVLIIRFSFSLFLILK